MFDGAAKLAPADTKALRSIMTKCCNGGYIYPDLCEVM